MTRGASSRKRGPAGPRAVSVERPPKEGFPEDGPVFRSFRQAAEAAFAFLVEEFGFRGPSVEALLREIHLLWIHEAAGVSVAVSWELGGEPTLALWLREPSGRGRCFGLDVLVADALGGPVASIQLDRMALPAAGSPEARMAALAPLFRRHAADLLRGDRGRLPRLRTLLARTVRERNRLRYGTSTGESPRFSHRPTLQELFADARDPGLRPPRATQAIHDYAYRVDELADFLACPVADVETLLAEWEDLTS